MKLTSHQQTIVWQATNDRHTEFIYESHNPNSVKVRYTNSYDETSSFSMSIADLEELLTDLKKHR
jgi:hypothetical protein